MALILVNDLCQWFLPGLLGRFLRWRYRVKWIKTVRKSTAIRHLLLEVKPMKNVVWKGSSKFNLNISAWYFYSAKIDVWSAPKVVVQSWSESVQYLTSSPDLSDSGEIAPIVIAQWLKSTKWQLLKIHKPISLELVQTILYLLLCCKLWLS